MLALLALVIGLAAATVWFVALPALAEPAAPKRSCEVYVLPSGVQKCVKKPSYKAQAASKKRKASRAKS